MADSRHGQLSVELVIVAAVMVGLLLAMFLVNDHLSNAWEDQKQSLEAGAAANQAALAINRAVAGGNGTQISFDNSVGQDVVSVAIFDRRSVRAYYIYGGYASAPIVTNNTNITAVPINRKVAVKNIEGRISLG